MQKQPTQFDFISEVHRHYKQYPLNSPHHPANAAKLNGSFNGNLGTYNWNRLPSGEVSICFPQ